MEEFILRSSHYYPKVRHRCEHAHVDEERDEQYRELVNQSAMVCKMVSRMARQLQAMQQGFDGAIQSLRKEINK